MPTAWMVRNDGLKVPCVQHIYGNADITDIEETIAAAEWLFTNTGKPSTKDLCLEFMRVWASDREFRDTDSMVRVLTDAINSRPYKFLSVDFLKQNADQIYNANVKRSLEELNAFVIAELNQEFMRARYGGMYNTNRDSREMVFRISSTGFDWYDIIFRFVLDNLSKIDTVTIVRDEESTGEIDKYYRTRDGKNVYKQFPIDDFIAENEKSNPQGAGFVPKIDENCSSFTKQIANRLARGKSFTELCADDLNRQRLLEEVKALSAKESQMTVKA